MALQAQSLIGLVAIPLIAWLLSEQTRAPSRRLGWCACCLAGVGLQLVIAGIMLNVAAVRIAFDWAAGLVGALQAATSAGMRLVFGYLAGAPAPFETVRPENTFILAFHALPLILVISALSKLLYHWGVLQRIVHGIGWVAAADARRIGAGGHVGGRQHLRRHGGGAAAGAALPRHHEPRGPVRDHDGRHGGRRRHGARHLRDDPAGDGARRGGPPDRRLRHQRAGGAAAVGADGAGEQAGHVADAGEADTTRSSIDDPPRSSMDAIAQGTWEGVVLLANVTAMLIVAVALVALANQLLGCRHGTASA